MTGGGTASSTRSILAASPTGTATGSVTWPGYLAARTQRGHPSSLGVEPSGCRRSTRSPWRFGTRPGSPSRPARTWTLRRAGRRGARQRDRVGSTWSQPQLDRTRFLERARTGHPKGWSSGRLQPEDRAKTGESFRGRQGWSCDGHRQVPHSYAESPTSTGEPRGPPGQATSHYGWTGRNGFRVAWPQMPTTRAARQPWSSGPEAGGDQEAGTAAGQAEGGPHRRGRAGGHETCALRQTTTVRRPACDVGGSLC